MELSSANYVNTTTVIELNSNSVAAENMFNPIKELQYKSDGFNNDATTATITIRFDATTTIDRIGILEHNWKQFIVYYDETTANAFACTTGAATTSTDFITNSATSLFFPVTAVNCTSVTFDIRSTIVANAEKAIGYLYVGGSDLDFSRIPSAKNYKPKLKPKQVVHKMSDGGTRIHRIEDKWDIQVKYKYIPQTFRDGLWEIFKDGEKRTFIPFGTSVSWDGILFECVWDGDFDFYEYSDNAVNTGYSGTIKLKEI